MLLRWCRQYKELGWSKKVDWVALKGQVSQQVQQGVASHGIVSLSGVTSGHVPEGCCSQIQ